MPKVLYQRRHERPGLQAAMQSMSKLISEVHPACSAVPGIGPIDFDNLVDSIKEHGLLEPVKITSDGQLIDGRCRIQACYVAGVTITSDQIVVTDDPPEAIAQANIARRHLTKDQRIMAAAKKSREAKIESKQNRAKALNNGGKNRNAPVVEKNSTTEAPMNRRIRTSEKIAKEEQVPLKKMTSTEKLLEVSPELADAVEAGDTALDDALSEAGIEPPAGMSSQPPGKIPLDQPKKASAKSTLAAMKNIRLKELGRDVYAVIGKSASIFYGANSKREAIVYASPMGWIVSFIDGDKSRELMQYKTREDAEFGAQWEVE